MNLYCTVQPLCMIQGRLCFGYVIDKLVLENDFKRCFLLVKDSDIWVEDFFKKYVHKLNSSVFVNVTIVL